jgi:hypothetical protein
VSRKMAKTNEAAKVLEHCAETLQQFLGWKLGKVQAIDDEITKLNADL